MISFGINRAFKQLARNIGGEHRGVLPAFHVRHKTGRKSSVFVFFSDIPGRKVFRMVDKTGAKGTVCSRERQQTGCMKPDGNILNGKVLDTFRCVGFFLYVNACVPSEPPSPPVPLHSTFRLSFRTGCMLNSRRVCSHGIGIWWHKGYNL